MQCRNSHVFCELTDGVLALMILDICQNIQRRECTGRDLMDPIFSYNDDQSQHIRVSSLDNVSTDMLSELLDSFGIKILTTKFAISV